MEGAASDEPLPGPNAGTFRLNANMPFAEEGQATLGMRRGAGVFYARGAEDVPGRSVLGATPKVLWNIVLKLPAFS